jgi:hypothetical protein
VCGKGQKASILAKFCVWRAGVKKKILPPKIEIKHIERFSPYRAVNTLCLGYKTPSVNGGKARFCPVSIIPPMFYTHLHLRCLSHKEKRVKCGNPLANQCCFGNRQVLDRKVLSICTERTTICSEIKENAFSGQRTDFLTFICLRGTTLSYDVAHRTVRS